MTPITQLRVRYVIAGLVLVIGILNLAQYSIRRNIVYWKIRANIAMTVIIFFTYVYAIRYKSRLHKYIRAFLVFALAIFWLYLNFDLTIEYTSGGRYPYACGSGDRPCMLNHSIGILSMITGFIIILEVAITAKNGPLPDTCPVILDAKQEQVPSQVMYASQVPQPLQPPLLTAMSQQQQQYMQSYPTAYYPQQQYQLYQGMPQQQQPPTTTTPQATGIL
ncbi:hypothetical protein BGX21_004044 [Mortierella sp. AD011]|nr:hypothetical protein BGX20_009269 [Mortierella sp. AD010]KAF9374780.1 hypothetical protein BGX21_004044 [Mortierella sp. AD011]